MHPTENFNSNMNPSISTLPMTQEITASNYSPSSKHEFEELQKLIMTFPSIIFTRTMVLIVKLFVQYLVLYKCFLLLIQLYVVSKLKSKQTLLTQLLQSLTEIGLLKQFEQGIIIGLRYSTLFIKSLPSTETLNTTNQFTLDLLDKINLPWLIYRPTCTTLLLPSTTSVISREANQYLQNGVYQK